MSTTERLHAYSTPHTQTVDAAPRRRLDSHQLRSVRAGLESMELAVATSIKNLAKSVLSSNRTVAEGLRLGTLSLYTSGVAAARLGYSVAGLSSWETTPEQVKATHRIAQRHLGYLAAFLQSLHDGNEAAMSPDRRAETYAGSVREQFWAGWLSALPSSVAVEWVLGLVEKHCKDCPLLAAGGPYSLPGTSGNPLPTVPRAGDTTCLFNCRCELESAGSYTSVLGPEIGVEVTRIGPNDVPPTSPGAVAAATLYRGLMARYAYFIRLVAAGVPHAMGDALKAKVELAAMAERMCHTIRPTITDAEIREPVERLLAERYRYVSPDRMGDDLVTLAAVLLIIDDVKVGRISGVDPGGFSIVLDSDPTNVYRLGAATSTILFVRDDDSR